jgi:hypothetical protein
MLRTTRAIQPVIADCPPIDCPLFGNTHLTSSIARPENQRSLLIPVELDDAGAGQAHRLEDFLSDSARSVTYSATAIEPARSEAGSHGRLHAQRQARKRKAERSRPRM